MRSSGNTMTVVFHTDASVSNGGFMASYSSEEPAGEILLSKRVIPTLVIATYP